ncbi:hypothetical protein QVD17_28537 [Tagetes erecta]|uniref:Uncharacterized protein n=1 Tax=Tagetes erecta TaxID=13708 RepID=A0AAD8NSU4_TARER|nr:hypothetical protein QVD17_28537 [Tagetes erecta]
MVLYGGCGDSWQLQRCRNGGCNRRRLVTNKDELSGYCDYLKSYKSKADEVEMVAPPLSRKARFASITGMEEKNEVKIRIPIKQRTKEPDHTQRTCGLYIQSIKRSSSSSIGQTSSSSVAVDPIMSAVDPIVP